jgi:hypothetical protein
MLMIDRANAAADVAQRNRYWSDAVLLFAGKWTREKSVVVLERGAVSLRAQELPAKAVPVELRELTDAVVNESWDSFGAFKQSHLRLDFRGRENWLGAFQSWFNKYLPLIMLGLSPLDQPAAEAELQKRIQWMLERAFDTINADDGLTAHFLDDAWNYARDHWSSMAEADPASTALRNVSPG